jgi:hypothetical protein
MTVTKGKNERLERKHNTLIGLSRIVSGSDNSNLTILMDEYPAPGEVVKSLNGSGLQLSLSL